MTNGDRMSRADDTSIPKRLVWFLVVILILLGLLFLYWHSSREVSAPDPAVELLRRGTVDRMPEDFLVRGEHYPLPEDGEPLPGRPSVAMPIPRKIYENVEVKIDGQRIQSPLRFRAGQHVTVEGVIEANGELNPHVSLGGGLALVTRATNRAGWHVRDFGFCGSNTRLRRCEFAGDYTFPDQPGEYILVVTSSAHVGHTDHPILIAAEYDLTLE